MQSRNIISDNILYIAERFPNVITETIGENGKVVRSIDFDKLHQELTADIVEVNEERYQFTWPGKREAMRLAYIPIDKTLRPCREESVDFNNTQNLYIEGDNLDVLKLLQENYLGKVKMIYVDPPYNTGKNLIYRNVFSIGEKDFLQQSGEFDEYNNRLFANTQSNGRFHSDWCSMIYSRLKVCRTLLSRNGIICLTIDDSEIHTVTAIMNEVFGESNHLATIIVKNNPSGRSTTKGASISHEYALFYGADEGTTLGRLPRNDVQIARYKEKDEVGSFEWVNFRKHGGYKEDAPSMYYPIYVKKDCTSFRIPSLKWDENQKEYSVLEQPDSDEIVTLPIDEQGRPRRWKWGLERALSSKNEMMAKKDRNGEPTVYIKARMNEDGMLPLTVWDDKLYSSTEYGANMLKKIFGATYFDYPKSLYAVIDSLRIGNLDEDSIILDFFSGSATTAHAVMRLNAEDGGNRKFILVQLPEKTELASEAYKAGYINICEIGKERIRRAGKKILEEQAQKKNEEGMFSEQSESSKLDVGFRVLKLDSSNMNEVYYTPEEFDTNLLFNENIKSDRTEEDLLFQVMLDLGIELSAKIEKSEIAGKTVWSVSEGYLLACFDEDVNESTITAIAKQHPIYFVMRDSSLASDNVADNFDQIFEEYSKDTIRKIL